jgi:hypothetical protein
VQFDLIAVGEPALDLASYVSFLAEIQSSRLLPSTISFVGVGSDFRVAMGSLGASRRDTLPSVIGAAVVDEMTALRNAVSQAIISGSSELVVFVLLSDPERAQAIAAAIQAFGTQNRDYCAVTTSQAPASLGGNPMVASAIVVKRSVLGLCHTLNWCDLGTLFPSLILAMAPLGSIQVIGIDGRVRSALQDTTSKCSTTFFVDAPELSIVVPTIDASSRRVGRLLESIRQHTNVPYEVLIVDNGNAPQGFSRPVNTGIRAATGRYIIVMNDDVAVGYGWWRALRDALSNGAKVAFPRTVQDDRRDFSAWCFAFRRDDLAQLSYGPDEFFDEGLAIWFQDSDLYLRLDRMGAAPELERRSVIEHGFSETLGTKDPVLAAWIRRTVALDQDRFSSRWGESGLKKIGFVDTLGGVSS